MNGFYNMYAIFLLFVDTFGEIFGVGIFAAILAFLLGTFTATFIPVGMLAIGFGASVGIGCGLGNMIEIGAAKALS